MTMTETLTEWDRHAELMRDVFTETETTTERPELRPDSLSAETLERVTRAHGLHVQRTSCGRVFADNTGWPDQLEAVELTGWTSGELFAWLGY